MTLPFHNTESLPAEFASARRSAARADHTLARRRAFARRGATLVDTGVEETIVKEVPRIVVLDPSDWRTRCRNDIVLSCGIGKYLRLLRREM